MASSDTDTPDAGLPATGTTGHDGDGQPEQAPTPAAVTNGDEERPLRRFRGSGASTAERDRMLKELRRIEFPGALRGYDRVAVDRYVEQMNRLVAELEISASPESAVRHALEEVSEETRGLLQRAHQTADEIVLRARARADEQLGDVERRSRELREDAEREVAELRQQAEQEVAEMRASARQEAQSLTETAAREAAELREAARQEAAEEREAAARESARLHAAAQRDAEELRETARRESEQMVEAAEGKERELVRSAETVWRERRRLIDDVRTVGDQLVAIGETEAKRFAHFLDGGVPADGGEPEPDDAG